MVGGPFNMDRRRLLVTAAAVVAVLGVVLVVVYARGADARAEDRFATVDVLVATQPIAAGESVESAEAAGKIGTGTVARADLLDGAQTALSGIAGTVALVSVHPGEQLIAAKFGSASDAAAALPIPARKMVAVFHTATDQATGQPFTRLLLPRVTVLGVGSAAPAAATTAEDQETDEAEQLPRTLLTIAVDQENAQKVLYASANGELAFALLNGESAVKPAPAVTGQNLFR
jgi:pilus assembly protein CpaB